MFDAFFQGRLLPGERVEWQGEPSHGIIFTARDLFLVPFSLLWCGFAIFWTFSATKTGASGFFMLWGGMFVCIGLYFVIGRFIVDAWIRRGMKYVVTDRRILIARSAPFTKFTVMNLNQLPSVDLSERADGSGTIRFGEAASMWGNRGMSSWSPSLDPTPQFIRIEDVRRVFELVKRRSHASG